jgi:hypothetical protein
MYVCIYTYIHIYIHIHSRGLARFARDNAWQPPLRKGLFALAGKCMQIVHVHALSRLCATRRVALGDTTVTPVSSLVSLSLSLSLPPPLPPPFSLPPSLFLAVYMYMSHARALNISPLSLSSLSSSLSSFLPLSLYTTCARSLSVLSRLSPLSLTLGVTKLGVRV